MEKLATENLFLFEFLVDNVNLDSKCDCDTPPGEHCVSFQFLDNDRLDVCEADFTTSKKDDSTKNGKSVLFSLTPEQIDKALEVFDVNVTVFKKMHPGWLPRTIDVGSALLSISNLFEELIKTVEVQAGNGPSAKTLKDTFKLMDSNGSSVGKITIYIRMSCFGKLIVTQFQMNLEDKSVLFKDKGGQSLYRYKKAQKQDTNDEETLPCNPDCPNLPFYPEDNQQFMPEPPMPYTPPNPNCPLQPCYGDTLGQFPSFNYPFQGYSDQNQYPYAQDNFYSNNAMLAPIGGLSPMLPCNECAMMMAPAPPSPPCFHPDRFNSQMLTSCDECGTLLIPSQSKGQEQKVENLRGDYQEIGASMGGNALTIRVHKDKKIEQVDGDSVSSGSCPCQSKKSPSSLPLNTTHAKNIQNFDIQPGVQQGAQNLPFTFKMSGAGQQPSNNVIINPPVMTKADGTKVTEISDPNKEMFILRIGKKSEGVQKKANLELELSTPRGPELKPIPKKETRDSQYDPSDVKEDTLVKSKGKKGKGKKDKKKGKKGKKK